MMLIRHAALHDDAAIRRACRYLLPRYADALLH